MPLDPKLGQPSGTPGVFHFIYVETVLSVKVMSLGPQAEAEGPTVAAKVCVV